MTLADAPPDVEDAPLDEAPVAEPEHSDEQSPRRDWKRVVAVVLAAILGALLVVALFTGPVENLWYRTRQHHLAADLQQLRQSTKPGQALGVLQVPRLGTNLVVVQGDTPGLLRGGPGHRISTPMPGARGNVVILGHRDAWGGPFGDLDRIRKRDFIVIQARDAKSGNFHTFVYRATSVLAVTAQGSKQLMGRSTDHRLTLVTGRGGEMSNDRLVVTAVSGPTTKNALTTPALHASKPGGSPIFNTYALMALVSLGLAYGGYRYLRRRAGTVAKAVVIVPLLIAGAFFVLLDLTLLLPSVN
jgi:sortase A